MDRDTFVKTTTDWNGCQQIVYRGFVQAYDNLYEGTTAVAERIRLHIETELGVEGKHWRFIMDDDAGYGVYGKPLKVNRDGEQRYLLWYPIEYTSFGHKMMMTKYGGQIVQHKVQKDPKKLNLVFAQA